MIEKIQIEFYFGVGSRYSYLAATQIPRIEAVGASVAWRPLFSPDLIRRFGDDPFGAKERRGQYKPAYRTEDATRWAAHYEVPYVEPDFDAVDWRTAALWATAAQLMTGSHTLGARVLQRCFGEGFPPTIDELRSLAISSALPVAKIEQSVDNGDAERQHALIVERAAIAGAFGVPTFIADDGSLFWGQDRIPLLLDHLRNLHRVAPT